MKKFPVIIAEAGVNHNGSLQNALRLIDIAKEAGADYVKFQTFKTENIVSRQTAPARYQKENCGAENQFEMLKRLELSQKDFIILKRHCNEVGIGFLSTPFDEESLDFLMELGMDYIKIPSGEITNYPFLKKISQTRKEVIISTGMSTLKDIENILQIFYSAGYDKNKITLLHCNTQYPTPFEDVNLLAMVGMRNIFGLETGYSDHTQGISVAIGAAALGASMIEKHFTSDRTLKGPDHIVSLNPEELSQMVRGIKDITLSLGSSEKEVSNSEKENIAVARKSIVAVREIKKGEIITEECVCVKRPGTGLSPMKWPDVIGSKAIRDFHPDDLIEI